MRTNLIPIKVEEPKETKKKPGKVKDEGLLDYVIAFDTTGSMSSYIAAVRKHVEKLVKDLLSTNPNIRIGIVAFGDYCDMKSPTEFGDAYQWINFTRDEKALCEFVKKAQNTSGGDYDEFYELVIKKITEEFDWRDEAKKTVLLIADACPHRVDYSYVPFVKNNQIDWKVEAEKSKAKGIEWDTLQCGHGEGWYKELSTMTNGIHAPFQSSGKTTEVVKAAAYSRGGDYTKEMFVMSLSSAEASGDDELTRTYTAYSKKLSD